MLVLCVLILLSLEDDPTIISEAYSVKPTPGELMCIYIRVCVSCSLISGMWIQSHLS